MQYQHEIVLRCCYFAANLVIKTNYLNKNQLCCIICRCKILELVVHSNVMNPFLHNDILCDNQHGFRAKRSCETQLITTLQSNAGQLRSGKDQGPVVQSVVTLTSSLRVIPLTVLADSIYNNLIFFAEKM